MAMLCECAAMRHASTASSSKGGEVGTQNAEGKSGCRTKEIGTGSSCDDGLLGSIEHGTFPTARRPLGNLILITGLQMSYMRN